MATPLRTALAPGNTGHLTDHDRLHRMFNMVIDADDPPYGLVGGGTVDDYPALNAALNDVRALQQSAPFLARGIKLRIPRGVFRISQTLKVDRGMVIEGAGSGGWFSATIIRPDEGVTAIEVESYLTSGDPTHGRGDWSHLSHFAIWGQSFTAGAVNHGIKTNAKIHLEDIYITNVKGDGVHNNNSVGITGDGSLNYWENVRVDYLGGDGFHDDGGDAQAGTRINCSAAGCGGWGFWDNSSYGNTFVGCHTAANALGGYFLRRGFLVHPYAEGDQNPLIQLGDEAIVIGGSSFAAGAVGGGSLSAAGNEMIAHSGLTIEPNREGRCFAIKRFSANTSEPFVQMLDHLGGQIVRWGSDGRLGIGGTGVRILTLVETVSGGGVAVSAPARTAANDHVGLSFGAGAGNPVTLNHWAPATAGAYADALEVVTPGNGSILLRPSGTGKVLCSSGIGVGNIVGGAPASAANQKMEIFDQNGTSKGFVAVSPS